MTSHTPSTDTGLARLTTGLTLPVIAAPMFLASGPDLVTAQCRAGVIGTLPALNARTTELFEEWVHDILKDLAGGERRAAPLAVNLIVNRSNVRLDADLDVCVRHRVPVVITSMGARADVNDAVHAYGGTVLHDVTTNRFAGKAVDRGADGLVAVAAGAGGHGGALSPFALVREIRSWFDGPLVLAGAISSGASVLAAQAVGADLAYVGSAFLATTQSAISREYREMVLAANAEDVVYTDAFTGTKANFLAASIRSAGLDPLALPAREEITAKPWSQVWGAGQGVGALTEQLTVDALVRRLSREYTAARRRLMTDSPQSHTPR